MDENCYNRIKFDRREAPKVVAQFTNSFRDYYQNLGYRQEKSVPISSGIDPTVRFIGSHISVLKPYLFSGEVPEKGIYIVQNCVRTQNLRRLFDETYFPRWGSFFPSLGVISPPNDLDRMVVESIGLLTDVFRIPRELIVIRVSREDRELFDSANRNFESTNLEIDTMPINYYRHKLGVPELRGRNFNFALKNCDNDEHSDVGNVIVLERNRIPVAIELALGSTTIIKQIFCLDHVLDCHSIMGLEDTDKLFGKKLEDCIITCLYLYREGLRPGGTDNRRRILKKYLEGVGYFKNKLGITNEHLEQVITNSEKLEFDAANASTDFYSDLNKIVNR